MRLNHVIARIEHQRTLRNLIETAVENLTKVGESNVTPQRITARLSSLKEIWEQFSSQHQAINLASSELSFSDLSQLHEDSYFADNIYALTHEQYLEAVERMNSFLKPELESHDSSLSSQSLTQTTIIPPFYHHARLPRIDLPKFNGTQANWLSFKDLFNSLVLMNPSLTSVEKLQYLKTSLTGTAALLLKDTALTADNFQKAWDALNSFYENKRLLVNSTLHSLITLKRMTKESASEMEQLYTSLMQIYRTLETLKRPVQYWDDFLVFNAVHRLDADSVKAWEQHIGAVKEPPSWKQFTDFLVTRLLTLQAFERCHGRKSVPHKAPLAVKSHFQGKSGAARKSSSHACSICSAKHYITACPRYTSKSVPQRIAIIAKHKLCYNCLGSHRSSDCRITKRCFKCGHKHHTSIHRASEPNCQPATTNIKSDTPEASASTATPANVLHSTSTVISNAGVLLATAQLILKSSNGENLRVRALIDQGSEISLVSERIVQLLRLPRKPSSIHLIGVGAHKSNKARGIVSLNLKPHFDCDFDCTIPAYILPRLTTTLPSTNVDSHSWDHLNGLLLADPEYCSPGSIDLLLGSDVYSLIIEDGVVKGGLNAPIAQRTRLGWIVSGPSTAADSSQGLHSYHISMNRELHDILQRFWEVEEVPHDIPSSLSNDEHLCEQHYRRTYIRHSNGKYQVRLPFKESSTKLGDSKAKATRIMTNLSKRLKTESSFSKAYSLFMEEYETLDHMRRIPDSLPEPRTCYYLPHHGVLRKNNSPAKIRVVFNGSSITTTGYSLNDLLHKGAKLQTDLFDVLIWFRQFRYVFSSEIEKMYRQIEVHPDDRDFQRILWIDQSKRINIYRLETVTYGLACAPFQALRTLQQLIEDEGKNYPLAVSTLMKGRYVDDVFGGADSVQEAQQIVQQVNDLCMAGGFPLHKWVSNEPEVLDSISNNKLVHSMVIHIEEREAVHALGLTWNPTTDAFNFVLSLTHSSIVTKRSVLSVIARMFDPLGLLSPVMITAKILIQELWSLRLDWDEPLPDTMLSKWNNFVKQLQTMPAFAFPRWINIKSGNSVEIHGFCDASQYAMAAAVYIKSYHSNEGTNVNLLCAKTKVAPLKRLTIPRLELSGAVLLTKLVSHILRVLQPDNTTIFLWTDSAVSLTWINNHPSRWKDFVHNRVCYIQETLPQGIWKFVPGKQNPADYATRGVTPAHLYELPDWWHGPSWLSLPCSAWPSEPPFPSIKENLEERPRKVAIVSKNDYPFNWNLIQRYSSLTRLLRITAICQRVVARLRRKADSLTKTPLTTQELENAKNFWIKATQQFYFRKEIDALSKGELISKASPLLRLTPFVDQAGLLRIGGRLHSSVLSFDEKHPIIIPKASILTSLIISDAHIRSMHGGTQLTASFIRNNFWIVGGRVPIRFILKCVKWFRQKRAQQLMGNLPVENVTPSRPFLHSGVDYAGPFVLKTWRGRNARTYKSYVALFVCHATSAVHLELVTDYTTDAFLAAYRRFTARRGICSTLMSDCGTNFKGADSELQTLFTSSISSEQLATLLVNDGTQWKFNPPASPHFGGKWEAGVKSVKHHLRRVVGETLLTYEELYTLLTQIEATLNSRPLCPLTDDPEDLSALTPGHFIMGSVPTIVPEPSLTAINTTRLSRWQLIRQMLESFWARWSSECLQRYLSIYKWNKLTPSLAVGSLVLVVDERYPPAKWPLGRIIHTHPGSDGLTRVVTVRTQTSVLKRPVVKICPLPIENDSL